MWQNIKVSIAVLKTTSLIIFRNIRMLFMPMLSSLFVVGWTCLWIYFFALLVSCGHIEQPTMGSQAKKISFTTGQWNMLFINAFMYLWIMEFIQAMF